MPVRSLVVDQGLRGRGLPGDSRAPPGPRGRSSEFFFVVPVIRSKMSARVATASRMYGLCQHHAFGADSMAASVISPDGRPVRASWSSTWVAQSPAGGRLAATGFLLQLGQPVVAASPASPAGDHDAGVGRRSAPSGCRRFWNAARPIFTRRRADGRQLPTAVSRSSTSAVRANDNSTRSAWSMMTAGSRVGRGQRGIGRTVWAD